MDRGTDARNFLLGNVVPLKLGYIGVVNRSQEVSDLRQRCQQSQQFRGIIFEVVLSFHCCLFSHLFCAQDITSNKSIRDALTYEETFFRTRPVRFLCLELVEYRMFSVTFCKIDLSILIFLECLSCCVKISWLCVASSQVYHNLSERCGIPQLAKKLNSVSLSLWCWFSSVM